MADPWCKGCGARVEWHPRVDGRLVSIDPDPHPDGTLAFGAGMKLQVMARGARPRMYRYHLTTCTKPNEATRKDAVTEERLCYHCKKPGHFANVCEEETD